MVILDLLVYSSGIVSSLFIAFAAVFIAAYLRRLEIRQRRATTAAILLQFADKMIIPRRALDIVSPRDFANPAPDDLHVDDARQKLLSFLNAMEYISLLVITGSVDEKLAREFWKGNLYLRSK